MAVDDGLAMRDARKALRRFWEYKLPLAGDEVAALATDTPRDSGILDTLLLSSVATQLMSADEVEAGGRRLRVRRTSRQGRELRHERALVCRH
jgi:hypothetical protein